ncbi:hypothetical protein Pan241w_60010 [Gimesia alba]|uniref:Uncharacterized protein n=1 Tax=Gimesia alba TaxID=2527973 RepID=A0A517RPR5_9PLAN|nr:hypothetical protein [Gimesia alba]QDT45873.1 hypothetical protein Pan241w_60010 [Gimesia alba]
MYRKAFPKCEIQGPLGPVKFIHGEFTMYIPRKCDECANLFEGECVRVVEQVEGYLSLDYGPCHREGTCEPVLVEDEFIKSKVYVPEKCSHCPFLKYHRIFGFRCHEDDHIWGQYGKSLDWGNWSPELPNIGLASGRIVSQELLRAVKEKQEVEAIRIYRYLHAGTSIREARDAFQELSEKLERICDDEEM